MDIITKPNRKVPVTLHDLTQVQSIYLHDDTHRSFVNTSGRRARKTLIGTRKILLYAMNNPGTNWLLGAPTRQQAKLIFWEGLLADTYFFKGRKPDRSNLIVYLINGSTIRVAGLDVAERIEGFPAMHGIMITEAAKLRPYVIPGTVLPMLLDTNGILILDGKPIGRNHYYHWASIACDQKLPTIIDGGTFKYSKINPEWAFYHWKSSDVITQDKIEEQRGLIDERTFRQEYDGEFVDYSGILYYNFSFHRDKIVTNKSKYTPYLPLRISCDFNNSPLVWEIIQKHGDIHYFIDEIVIPTNAKSKEATINFIEEYKDHPDKIVYVYGDASGKWETTRDYSMDYAIIKEELEKYGWEVNFKVPKSNPGINNRINLVCTMIEKHKILINPENKYLIKDLESNVSDSKGAKDKSNSDATHASDATDYYFWEQASYQYFGLEMTQ